MEGKKKGGKRKAESEVEINEVKEKKGKKNSHLTDSKDNDKLLKSEKKKITSTAKNKNQATLDMFKINIKPSASSDINHLPELPKGKNVKIYSWNVNGIRAMIKKGAIEEFIQKEDPDILCFNETKIDLDTIKKEKIDKLYSDKYMSFWNSCSSKGGYSGVAIFTKYRPHSILYGIDHEDHDEEGRVLTLEFENFYLVAVYVPNAGEGLKRLDYRVGQWDVEFFKFLDKLKEKKNVIICGDLNVAHKEIDIFEPSKHLKSPGFTIEERNSFTEFLSRGYIDTFRHFHPEAVKFTYFSARRGKAQKEANKGWRLDYFVINESSLESLHSSEILNEYEGSDHCPIKIEWKV